MPDHPLHDDLQAMVNAREETGPDLEPYIFEGFLEKLDQHMQAQFQRTITEFMKDARPKPIMRRTVWTSSVILVSIPIVLGICMSGPPLHDRDLYATPYIVGLIYAICALALIWIIWYLDSGNT